MASNNTAIESSSEVGAAGTRNFSILETQPIVGKVSTEPQPIVGRDSKAQTFTSSEKTVHVQPSSSDLVVSDGEATTQQPRGLFSSVYAERPLSLLFVPFSSEQDIRDLVHEQAVHMNHKDPAPANKFVRAPCGTSLVQGTNSNERGLFANIVFAWFDQVTENHASYMTGGRFESYTLMPTTDSTAHATLICDGNRTYELSEGDTAIVPDYVGRKLMTTPGCFASIMVSLPFDVAHYHECEIDPTRNVDEHAVVISKSDLDMNPALNTINWETETIKRTDDNKLMGVKRAVMSGTVTFTNGPFRSFVVGMFGNGTYYTDMPSVCNTISPRSGFILDAGETITFTSTTEKLMLQMCRSTIDGMHHIGNGISIPVIKMRFFFDPAVKLEDDVVMQMIASAEQSGDKILVSSNGVYALHLYTYLAPDGLILLCMWGDNVYFTLCFSCIALPLNNATIPVAHGDSDHAHQETWVLLSGIMVCIRRFEDNYVDKYRLDSNHLDIIVLTHNDSWTLPKPCTFQHICVGPKNLAKVRELLFDHPEQLEKLNIAIERGDMAYDAIALIKTEFNWIQANVPEAEAYNKYASTAFPIPEHKRGNDFFEVIMDDVKDAEETSEQTSEQTSEETSKLSLADEDVFVSHDDPGNDPILNGVVRGNLEDLKMTLENFGWENVDPDTALSMMLMASYHGHIHIMEWVNNKYSFEMNSDHILMHCVEFGQLEAIQWLYKNREDIKFDGSELNIAQGVCNMDIVEWLCDNMLHKFDLTDALNLVSDDIDECVDDVKLPTLLKLRALLWKYANVDVSDDDDEGSGEEKSVNEADAEAEAESEQT